MRVQTFAVSPLLPFAAAMALALGASVAHAATFNEVEGNDTFATANLIASGTHTINGAINPDQDVDFYRFSNLVAGSNFNATVTGKTTTSGVFDIATVVFDSSGHSWWGNDGTDGAIDFTITQPGTYYLAVSSWQNEAMDGFGNFLREDFFWTDDETTGTTFAGWSGDAFGGGNYTLSVNSVSAVPVPAAVWLLGSGLAGLMGMARRGRTTA